MKAWAGRVLPSEWVFFVFSLIIVTAFSLSSGQPGQNNWFVFPEMAIVFVTIGALLFRSLKFSEIKNSIFWKISTLIGTAGVIGFVVNRNAPPLLLFALSLFLLFLGESKSGKNTGVRDFIQTLRLILPFLALISFYPFIPVLIDALGVPKRDFLLMAWDRVLFGTDPVLQLQGFIKPFISEILAAVYISYGALILSVVAILMLAKDRKPLEETVFTLTFTFAAGYLGYILVPAIGPLYTQSFSYDLDIVWLKNALMELADTPRIATDCFPSLHTGATLVCAWASYRHAKVYFRLFAPFFILMPLACVYLRYHYVVDVLAGFVVALVAIGITRCVFK